MKFKVGDVVICIREEISKQFIGTSWTVVEIVGTLYMCKNEKLYLFENYPFKESELVEAAPLLLELL